MGTNAERGRILAGLRQAVDQLERRRSMYIGDSFESLVAFFVGYSVAVKQSTGLDLMAEVKHAVMATYHVEFAVMWPYFLLEEVAKGDEKKATDLFFATVVGFTEQRQKEDGRS